MPDPKSKPEEPSGHRPNPVAGDMAIVMGLASMGGLFTGKLVCEPVEAGKPLVCPVERYIPVADIHWDLPERGSTSTGPSIVMVQVTTVTTTGV